MRKILILFAHPLPHKSRVNSALVQAVRKMSGVTFHDLYEEYPDFFIDVKREQDLLLQHDLIIWQHPFYWYSAPAILKEWFDLVLEHGFAYGRTGEALKGKYSMSVITTGGSKDTYNYKGHNQYPVTQFLLPYKQASSLCQMTYLPPMVFHGTHLMSERDLDIAKMDYIKLISLLRDGKQPLKEIKNNMFANEYLND
nr:NAD(P)H-dependent oxidoreductase [uncultured Carboxylicivirga sp.]